ncbi:hypothetical protein AAHA92_17242 [Salvia divinorum]|uniref:Retrotransposon gag domain-containing protein n=1 Tax=Salvia divinorum TaxID=28513 RepID=A0ABD1H1L7_SALDI
MRLVPNSIRMWAEFRIVFLDQFFPSTKTSALKKEILRVTQDYDEPLSQYWERYMDLLDACPNHHMSEAEIYSTFYEGMNKETKDLANSSSGGGFPHLRVSEAKRVMGRLLSAKRAYDNPRDCHVRRGAASASTVEKKDK